MIHDVRPIPVDQNELFIPRHLNDHLTLENGYQIGMLGEYSTHFITFNQGVFMQIHYHIRDSHIDMYVDTPPVAAPPAARHVPVSWLFCCVVSDIVSAFIMEDVPEVRVFLFQWTMA